MKARFILSKFIIVLIIAYPILAIENSKDDSEIESITGTREPDDVTTEIVYSGIATTAETPNRQSRRYRPTIQARGDDDHYHHDDDEIIPEYHDEHHEPMKPNHDEDKAMASGKADFGGYYDFLINEGSYKFWAVFQLATAALLIYSGFAALYYAKVNPTTDDDYGDYFLRRRRSVDRLPRERNFLGLSPETFQRILDAIAREFH